MIVEEEKNAKSPFTIYDGAFKCDKQSNNFIISCIRPNCFGLMWFVLGWSWDTHSDWVLISVFIVHSVHAHCYDIAINIMRSIHSARISYTRKLTTYATENFLRTMNSDQVQCAWIVGTNYFVRRFLRSFWKYDALLRNNENDWFNLVVGLMICLYHFLGKIQFILLIVCPVRFVHSFA